MVRYLIAGPCILGILFLYRRKGLPGRISVLCIFACLLGVILSFFESGSGHRITEIEKGASTKEMRLQVNTSSGEKFEMELSVPEQKRSAQDAIHRLEELAGQLESIMLGENKSLSRIEWNLNFPRTLADGEVAVEWFPENPQIIDFDGSILQANEEGLKTEIRAILRLDMYETEFMRSIIVFPSKEGGLQGRIRERMAEENKDAEGGIYYLPSSAGGTNLQWQAIQKQNGILLCVGSFVAGILFLLWKKEQKKQTNIKKQEYLKKEYPELVAKLQLYLSAGLTVKNAFLRMTEADKPLSEAEKILAKCIRLPGCTELEQYERFGQLCGLPEYKGLVLILSQNLRKGGAGILSRMEEEVQKAYVERRRFAKEEGEKTSIRLLLPLGLLMGIVMALILVPAFVQMG